MSRIVLDPFKATSDIELSSLYRNSSTSVTLLMRLKEYGTSSSLENLRYMNLTGEGSAFLAPYSRYMMLLKRALSGDGPRLGSPVYWPG